MYQISPEKKLHWNLWNAKESLLEITDTFPQNSDSPD